jgi:hypothetical protein
MSAPADPAPKVGALLWVEADWRGETSMPLATADPLLRAILIAAMLVGGLSAYCMPSLIAWRRQHTRRYAIAALNVLGGWTGLGWIAALVWALAAFVPEPTRPMSHERRE